MMLVLLMVMAAAALAIFVVVTVLMLLMMMTAAALAIFVVVMVLVLLMVVTAAALAILVVMVMLVLLMMVAAAALTLFVVMVMVVMVLMLHLGKLGTDAAMTFHSLLQLRSGQFLPRGSYQHGALIVLTKQRYGLVQLILHNIPGAGKDDGRGSLDLIIVELTKVLHIHLDLAGIHNSNLVANSYIVTGNLFHRSHNIGQLAHAGGLDDNTVRMVLCDDLLQRLAEIAHQRAANTAGIHLCNVDTGLLQETAVNADLAEFIFDQYQFLSAVGFLDHLLDESSLACAQKTGININNSHG
jgi:hypothetical protein